MNIDNPYGTDDNSPLSLEEAAAAYANLNEPDEPEDGQSDDSADEQGDEVENVNDELDETEDDGQAEDEQEPPPEQPAYVADDAKVKLADGSEVTVAELKNGTLRLQDYRQKTAELAEQRRSVESKASEFQQLEQQMVGDRDFMAQLLQHIMPQKPDPNLFAVDPIGYQQQKLNFDQSKEWMDYLLSQQRESQTRKSAQEQEEFQARNVTEAQALIEKMPELRDEKRRNSFSTEIGKHGSEYGYSPQELSQIGLDHRQVLVMRDAIAWRKLQASKSTVAAKVEGRPPVQRGGTRQSPQAQRARDQRVALDRLKSSGSLRDGVAALLALEKD